MHRGTDPASASPPCGLSRKIDAIRALGLFADVPGDDLLPLATSSLLRRFERGQRIARLGANDECVILAAGRAKTSTLKGAGRGAFTLATFDAGDIVSENCWVTGEVTLTWEAIALSDCEVLFLPRRALDAFLEGHGEIAVRLLVATVNKLSRLTRLATRYRSLDVGDRLYCKLTEFAMSIGRDVDGGIFVAHGLQQGELASSIGASREAVNRQLALWRDQGLITLRRGALLLKDPVGLKMAVSPQARSVDLDIGTPTA